MNIVMFLDYRGFLSPDKAKPVARRRKTTDLRVKDSRVSRDGPLGIYYEIAKKTWIFVSAGWVDAPTAIQR